MRRIRISAPKTATLNEVIELKAMIQHPMETGFRPDPRGNRIGRDIITDFICRFDGDVIFQANFHPSVAANPFLSFHMRATRSGTLHFEWRDQNGERWSDTRVLKIS